MEDNTEELKKCSTYEDFLRAGKNAIEAVKRPFKVREAKNALKGEIIKLESGIAEAELEIVKAKSAHPLDLDTILDKIDDKQTLERKLRQANELMEELFPAEKINL